jgi:hypothetical protein
MKVIVQYGQKEEEKLPADDEVDAEEEKKPEQPEPASPRDAAERSAAAMDESVWNNRNSVGSEDEDSKEKARRAALEVIEAVKALAPTLPDSSPRHNTQDGFAGREEAKRQRLYSDSMATTDGQNTPPSSPSKQL